MTTNMKSYLFVNIPFVIRHLLIYFVTTCAYTCVHL